MAEKKTKIRIRRRLKQRAPHRPTRVHRDKSKYTRKGRSVNLRRRELLKEWQQETDE